MGSQGAGMRIAPGARRATDARADPPRRAVRQRLARPERPPGTPRLASTPMHDAITDVAGIEVGHFTDAAALTGCTAAGRAAAAAATAKAPERGCAGAGTGATVGKVLGMERATKSGLGTASVDAGAGVTVGAIVVANAGGDVVDPGTGAIVAGTRTPDGDGFADSVALVRGGFDPPPPIQQTTLAVVATDAPLTVEQANHLASVAHDG